MSGGALFHAPSEVQKLHRLVELRLRAFDLDGNPHHVFVAWQATRSAGMVPAERLLGCLDQAIENLREHPGRGRSCRPQYTLRDIGLLDALSELRGSPQLPHKLDSGTAATLATRFRMNPAAVQVALSRLRRRIVQTSARS